MKQVTLLFILILLPHTAAWADDSGSCGSGLSYSYVEANHTLTISKTSEGTGMMDNYNDNYYYNNPNNIYNNFSPWVSYKQEIVHIILEEGVTSIGNDAFVNCNNLSSVSIPSSIKSMGRFSFACSPDILSVYISDLTAWCDIIFDSSTSNPFYCANILHIYLNGEEISKLIIPNDVTSIASYAFCGCRNFTSVIIPNSVKSIGDNAFAYCFNLISVSMPDSLTYLGQSAFEHNNSLTSIIIPEGVNRVREYAFSECGSLKSITIPNSLDSLEFRAIYMCSNLTTINIPSNVSYIGSDNFYGCILLNTVNISDIESWCKIKFGNPNANPLSCAHHLYLNGEEIKDLIIPEGITSINAYSFYSCNGLSTVSIPNGVTSIGQSAFKECTNLSYLSIGNNVNYIGNSAFESCYSLTSVKIPDLVSCIEENTFANCGKMKSLSLPENLNIIKNYAFSNCSSLKELLIPSKVDYIYQNAFVNCFGLEKVTVLAPAPPFAYDNSFNNYNIPLYVQETSSKSYQTTSPWNMFTSFKTLSGENIKTNVCSTPTICYENRKLKFSSETDGVEFVTDITDSDVKKYHTATISLSATYNISVYATKAGYDNSDLAKATLCWIDAEPRKEGIADGIATVRANPVLIQSSSNTLTITGPPEGTDIIIYNLTGQEVGSAKANFGTTNISTSLRSGEVGIVKIGEKSVKIVIQ